MGDHIDDTRVLVNGRRGKSAVHDCLKAVMFDGIPLGAHVLRNDREPNKRQNEMLALGHVLVGTGVDIEVSDIRSLSAAHARAAADFEASLLVGGKVRIELCRIANVTEKRCLDAVEDIERRTTAILNATPNIPGLFGTADPFYVRINARVPTRRDVVPAAAELGRLVLSEGPSIPKSDSMRRVGPQYPVLHDLEVHWTRVKGKDLGLQIERPRHLLGRFNGRDEFTHIMTKKAQKILDYSEGGQFPVWLATFVDTAFTIPYGIIEAFRAGPPLDPVPFRRLLLGCLTNGVTFGGATSAA
jgi:hypothetical protein